MTTIHTAIQNVGILTATVYWLIQKECLRMSLMILKKAKDLPLAIFVSCVVIVLTSFNSHSSQLTINAHLCLNSYGSISNYRIDIPKDHKLFSKIANQGFKAIKDINIPDQTIEEFLYYKFQEYFKVKFREKTVDEFEHKADSFEIIHDLSNLLNIPNLQNLQSHFLEGKYAALIQYSNEFKDPISNKATGLPNYIKINHALRSLEHNNHKLISLPLPLKNLIIKIDSALSKLPSVKGVVYRGTSLKKGKIYNIIQQRELIDNAYLSTSIDITDAYEFLRKAPLRNEKEKVLMIIYTRNGKFIPYGEFSREEEVLLPRPPYRGQLKLNYYFKHSPPDNSSEIINYMFFSEQE